MSSRLFIALISFGASVVAQSTPSVVCIAGQCLQGFSNITIGASISAPGAPTNIHLLPGQYTSTTNPQFLHNLLTAPSASIAPAPGFNLSSTVSLPLNVALSPGIAVYLTTSLRRIRFPLPPLPRILLFTSLRWNERLLGGWYLYLSYRVHRLIL
ncbi:hypothetical protein ONZ45_g10551 [Pleurotus djamor]|nr:hypothetical protein ONZ45_g10551 [Pleurotus djamor]